MCLFIRAGLLAAAVTLAAHAPSSAFAQGLTINSVSVSAFGKQALCGTIGGQSVPPTITITHSKASGAINVSIRDQLSDGRTIDHGSTSVSADPSGKTVLRHAFRPPCNTSNGRVKSAYYVTATAGTSSKTVLWGRY